MYVTFTLMILDFFLFHTHLEAVVSVNSLDPLAFIQFMHNNLFVQLKISDIYLFI